MTPKPVTSAQGMPTPNAQVIGFSVAIAILVTGLLLLMVLMALMIVKKVNNSKEAIPKGIVHVYTCHMNACTYSMGH